MMSASVLEAVLRRDRAIIVVALSVLTVLAWADLWLADDMSMGGMDMTGFRMIPAGQGLMMPASEPWKPIEFGYVLAMWAVMMIGMMTPSVAPMILIYARVGRQAVGALTLRHGIYCIGCCWALMTLLFVVGVMNLFWIAALAILVLLEKVIPSGRIIAQLAGVVFMVGGGLMLIQHA
jgi:predicted metal-binding membrane protein